VSFIVIFGTLSLIRSLWLLAPPSFLGRGLQSDIARWPGSREFRAGQTGLNRTSSVARFLCTGAVQRRKRDYTAQTTQRQLPSTTTARGSCLNSTAGCNTRGGVFRRKRGGGGVAPRQKYFTTSERQDNVLCLMSQPHSPSQKTVAGLVDNFYALVRGLLHYS